MKINLAHLLNKTNVRNSVGASMFAFWLVFICNAPVSALIEFFLNTANVSCPPLINNARVVEVFVEMKRLWLWPKVEGVSSKKKTERVQSPEVLLCCWPHSETYSSPASQSAVCLSRWKKSGQDHNEHTGEIRAHHPHSAIKCVQMRLGSLKQADDDIFNFSTTAVSKLQRVLRGFTCLLSSERTCLLKTFLMSNVKASGLLHLKSLDSKKLGT